MHFDPDAIASFATFDEEFDDQEWADLVAGAVDWQPDAATDRQRFDAVWQQASASIASRLGESELTGYHSEEWQHSVWRIGPRLLVVAQGGLRPGIR